MNGITLDLPVLGTPGPLAQAADDSSRLPKAGEKQYWRSLEELADTPEFDNFVRREYPSQMEVLVDPVSRRSFLKLMGASAGLAGLAACTVQPKEEIIPYIKQPEEIVPGKALYFATAMPRSGGAMGLLVRSNEGRPTKIEGNPDHPASLGATDIFAQAAILELYDPDRSQAILHLGDIRAWGDFVTAMSGRASGFTGTKGAGLRFLTESITSPSLNAMLKGILADLPQAKWHQWEPAKSSSAFYASQAVFGAQVTPHYRFDKALRVLSLDSDFMMDSAASVRYARDWAQMRRVSTSSTEMSRLYVMETTATTTGSNADNRVSVRPSEFEAVVDALANRLGVGGAGAGHIKQQSFIDAVAKDLLSYRGRSIVIAGEWQSPHVHALAHQINAALGNVGQTVFYSEPVDANPVDHLASITDLALDMAKGEVEALVILGGVNPVYSAPRDLNFAQAMKKVPFIVHHGLYYDETAELAQWHIPEAHFLESWSDARAQDGTASIIQPLISPLYQGKTSQEVLSPFTKDTSAVAYDIVKNYWTSGVKGGDVEKTWRRALNDGVIQNTSIALKTAQPSGSGVPSTVAQASGFDLVFRPDPSVWDGRYANLGWLQELPKPITKLTWDNAALMSNATAERLGLSATLQFKGGSYESDIVYIEVNGLHLEAPVWIVPGHPDDTITLPMGYGRRRAGRVGNNLGFDAGLVRTSKDGWFVTGAKVRKTGSTYQLAGTQIHFTMEGREAVRSATFEEYKKTPNYVHEQEPEPSKDMGFFPKYQYTGYAWGMTIDLNSCIGCNACMIACVAENNIPVVGKEQVARSREMHWIRVDRYYTGAADDPETYYQPVPCQQCEDAPCELVCPVDATSHSAEGLNDMVYNRCVGTRYCGNNCPYKVRRFNFLLYQDWTTPQYKMLRNPEVSVRSRGVMEKCTYCVQRIQTAKIDSEKEGRRVRDGEIITACEAACPTDAIVFGDINDPNSRVAKLKSDSRNYSLLGDLNTHPRTTYLGVVRNPNPEIKRELVKRTNSWEESA
ncbi:MAG: TAT-variant-translocated molybdopterin oxidoreductase [Bacteroidota bacterium]|nr:TAT-variant-translocated molybdopterin oxidoreductase [Bacteroidota bacterium]MDP4234617.1 TAT-variant-translocated molybdopterin oxidoreductase [Bacteroidota bacterium]MDP4243784.1 TAT-variant-translocated molybdopterin oxidoreductase [Bacteroidota bacterium]MDP4288978.1 TAT-variant-translocated molybdopterin oxidoreductase [Bacteroidota bacterium]